jgi:hypothetical protein
MEGVGVLGGGVSEGGTCGVAGVQPAINTIAINTGSHNPDERVKGCVDGINVFRLGFIFSIGKWDRSIITSRRLIDSVWPPEIKWYHLPRNMLNPSKKRVGFCPGRAI